MPEKIRIEAGRLQVAQSETALAPGPDAAGLRARRLRLSASDRRQATITPATPPHACACHETPWCGTRLEIRTPPHTAPTTTPTINSQALRSKNPRASR